MTDFLRRILDPATTAVLTMELQQGVVGPESLLPALVDEVHRTGIVDVARRVCDTAREAGARVLHCTAVGRPDGAGSATNCRILASNAKLRRQRGYGPTDLGTPGADLMPGLEDPRDIVVSRMHGMTPFTSTSLDQILRNLGIHTVVATGVSLNVGILGMALSAVDLGYQVVVVRDAVAGVPAEYGAAVLEHSLSMIATVVTSEEVTAALVR
jgi:nicotinamidase-related amidase